MKMRTDPHVDPALFRTAMRRPASTVAVITAGTPGRRVGVTVTAVCSLSDTPPMVLSCLHRMSSALPTIREAGTFCINFLTEEQQDVAEVFAGRGQLAGEERFSIGRWGELVTGSPVLSEALASFDCALDQEQDSPTHAILLGRVLALSSPNVAPPLLYGEGNFGRLAHTTL